MMITSTCSSSIHKNRLSLTYIAINTVHSKVSHISNSTVLALS